MTARDQDFRTKLTSECHRAILELARCANITMGEYVQRVIVEHVKSKLDEARRLVAATSELGSVSPRLVAPDGRPARVYFVRRGESGPIKIGIATSVAARIKSLQTGSEEVLTLLHDCEQQGEITERKLHRRFRTLRLEGEWFQPAEELLAFIEELRALRSAA